MRRNSWAITQETIRFGLTCLLYDLELDRDRRLLVNHLEGEEVMPLRDRFEQIAKVRKDLVDEALHEGQVKDRRGEKLY